MAFAADGPPPLRHTARLRTAATVLIWIVTGASLMSTVALYRNLSVVRSFYAGDASLTDLDRSDVLVIVAVFFEFAVLIAAGVVVAIWTLRTVRNAEAIGRLTIGARLAAWGWIIPIGNLFLPFVRLRNAMSAMRGETKWVSWWQAGWIAMTIVGRFVNLNGSPARTEQEFVDALSTEAGIAAFTTVITAATAVAASRAMKHADGAIDARAAALADVSRGPSSRSSG